MNKKNFGQVFTPDFIANFMISLIKGKINKNSSCLDPCVGQNIFFKTLIKKTKYKQLVGIEIDEELITKDLLHFYKSSKTKFYNIDFFNYDIKNKFEIIIMNPPYVRQEEIVGKINNKSIIKSKFKNFKLFATKKSNLFVPFLVKALIQLKKEGILVAITYDAWLYTDYGKIFKRYLWENYCIKKIIHFENGAFEGISVGATIILIENKKNQNFIEYYNFKFPSELKDIKSSKIITLDKLDFINFSNPKAKYINFDEDIFIPIDKLIDSKVQRGINALKNNLFLFKYKKFNNFCYKIIKSPNEIKNYSIEKEIQYILKAPKVVSDKSIKKYLELIKQQILIKPESFKALSQIINNQFWYEIKGNQNYNIIFNYYFRKNIDFILNNNNYLVSDNFYNFNLKESIYEKFAILNSNITRFSILKYSKTQGEGLFKIQLNEFRKIKVINLNKISRENKLQLAKLGKELSLKNRKESSNIISNIDKILINQFKKYFPKNTNSESIKSQMIKIFGLT